MILFFQVTGAPYSLVVAVANGMEWLAMGASRILKDIDCPFHYGVRPMDVSEKRGTEYVIKII